MQYIEILPRKSLAETILSSTAWAYYRSAGDDNMSECTSARDSTRAEASIPPIAFHENRESFTRFWFRPRV